MFNDKKKFFKILIFLFIILIFSLNSIHAADLEVNFNSENDNQYVEDNIVDFDNQNTFSIVYDNSSFDNQKDTNLSSDDSSLNKDDFNISYNNMNDSKHHYIIYVASCSNIASSSANGLSIHNTGFYYSYGQSNLVDSILDGYLTSNGYQNLNSSSKPILIYIISSDEHSDLVNNLTNVFILANNYITFQYNTLSNFRNLNTSNEANSNDPERNISIILFNEDNVDLQISSSNNYKAISIHKEDIGNYRNINNNSENNQAIDYERYSTYNIFIIPELDSSGDLLYNNEYFDVVKIHSGQMMSTINIGPFVRYYNHHQYLCFLDISGKPLINSLVTFNINGVFYSKTTDERGIACLDVDLNNDYVLNEIKCGNNSAIYYSILDNIENNLIEYYNEGNKYFIKLLDYDGKAVSNVAVTFDIGGISYFRTTDSKGITCLDFDLSYGEYALRFTHPLYGLEFNGIIELLPNLIGEDITINHKDIASYKVRLVDDEGMPIVGEVISMNIDDVFYEIFTDKNGIARLDINLNPGYYTIISTYQDFSISNKIIVK